MELSPSVCTIPVAFLYFFGYFCRFHRQGLTITCEFQYMCDQDSDSSISFVLSQFGFTSSVFPLFL